MVTNAQYWRAGFYSTDKSLQWTLPSGVTVLTYCGEAVEYLGCRMVSGKIVRRFCLPGDSVVETSNRGIDSYLTRLAILRQGRCRG